MRSRKTYIQTPPNTSQQLFGTRCTISHLHTGVRQLQIFMEQAGLPWRGFSFLWVEQTQLLSLSTKTLNAHSLNTLQQPFRIDARTFSCQIRLTSEYNLDVGKGDCLPFHMPITAASGTYSWLAVGLHVISG